MLSSTAQWRRWAPATAQPRVLKNNSCTAIGPSDPSVVQIF
jgi:hypothetical protein